MKPHRLAAAALFALAPLAGCTFENRVDGGDPRHADNLDGDLRMRPDETALVAPVEPLDDAAPAPGQTPSATPVAPSAAGSAVTAPAASPGPAPTPAAE